MISKDIDGNQYEVVASELTWRPSVYGIVIPLEGCSKVNLLIMLK